MANSVDQAYLTARKALLDVLDILGPHLKSVILVGAQAVYVHVGEADFSIAPFTYDSDLAIEPRDLVADPKLVEVMGLAQFFFTNQPGLYKRTADGAQVDLLVPEAIGGAGRRGARLGPQGNNSAMKVHGLEGAIVDHAPEQIGSFDSSDLRSHTIEVASPAALCVSKIIKIAERDLGDLRRQDSKDAFDVFRLLRAVPTLDLAAGLKHLLDNSLSSTVTSEAIGIFEEYFGAATKPGVQMVVKHVQGLEPEDIISSSCVALSRDLINCL